MWEVAGLLFLITETKDKVEKGMRFLSESLLSAGCMGDVPLIFFLDKDFDYINVVEEMFLDVSSSFVSFIRGNVFGTALGGDPCLCVGVEL